LIRLRHYADITPLISITPLRHCYAIIDYADMLPCHCRHLRHIDTLLPTLLMILLITPCHYAILINIIIDYYFITPLMPLRH
jgi:hypothetical protein